jgi:hypothetical protein
MVHDLKDQTYQLNLVDGTIHLYESKVTISKANVELK